MAKRVCVIGAGISGLVALKTCLEDGLQAVCFEKSDNIGGLWRFRDKDVDGMGSVMKSTIIDTSKEMSALSDFPPSAEYANFMHNSSIIQYFEEYADQFQLRSHIRCGYEVLSIKKSSTYDETGQWIVIVKTKKGDTDELLIDAVMVCVGHHVSPKIPSFPGLEQYKGDVFHTHSYKDHRGYEDKNVLLVGVGNSGLDVAVELGRVAKHVYLSTRRGAWIASRVGENGIPWDIIYSRRYLNFFFNRILPWSVTNSYFERMVSKRMDHELYNIKPDHRFFSQHPTLADDLPNRILAGAVTVRPDIDHFTSTGVIFQGDEKEHEIDVVVFATGYDMKYPFMEEVVQLENNVAKLYQLMWPPELTQPTFAVIGLVQPHGCLFPVSEMQSRVAVKVFKEECILPTKETMLAEIQERRRANLRQFVQSTRHTVDVNYIDYMDELAETIGVRPKLGLLAMMKDPRLYAACMFGPAAPYQYRLNGPHPWKGARDAILTISDRTKKPLQTRYSKSHVPNLHGHFFTIVAFGATILVVILALVFSR